MNGTLSSLLYLVSSVCFILALRGLSSPESARRGNLLGIFGMILAIGTTVAGPDMVSLPLIAVAVLLGGAIGTAIAHIVQTCTQSGTLNAAAVAVATVPPNPGTSRTESKNAGEPIGKRFTHAGRRWR